MRVSAAIRAATAAALVVCVGWGPAGQAGGSPDPAINGTYTAVSNGQWAKTNDSYRDEATVVSTWTITSTCTSPAACTGQVRSDQGWTADLQMSAGRWTVYREIADWEPCPDGTAYPGQQLIYFYPVDGTGHTVVVSSIYAGKDKTVGPSGACGISKWLAIEMPFRLTKLT